VKLPAPELQRLVRMLGMTGSDHDGEALNAARAAYRLVRTHGLTWEEVLQAEPPVPVVVQQPTTPRYWKNRAEECLFDHSQAISAWETDFLTDFLQDILRRGYALSVKQESVMRRIATKTGVPEW
jgi:hypothetical protein